MILSHVRSGQSGNSKSNDYNMTIRIFLFSQTRDYFEMVLKEDRITVETCQGTQITPENSPVSVVREKR